MTLELQLLMLLQHFCYFLCKNSICFFFDVLAPSHLMNKSGSTIRLVSYFDASFVLTPKASTVTVLSIITIFLVLATALYSSATSIDLALSLWLLSEISHTL